MICICTAYDASAYNLASAKALEPSGAAYETLPALTLVAQRNPMLHSQREHVLLLLLPPQITASEAPSRSGALVQYYAPDVHRQLCENMLTPQYCLWLNRVGL